MQCVSMFVILELLDLEEALFIFAGHKSLPLTPQPHSVCLDDLTMVTSLFLVLPVRLSSAFIETPITLYTASHGASLSPRHGGKGESPTLACSIFLS